MAGQSTKRELSTKTYQFLNLISMKEGAGGEQRFQEGNIIGSLGVGGVRPKEATPYLGQLKLDER